MTSNPSPKECIVEQAMESKSLRKFENSIEVLLKNTQVMALNDQSEDIDFSSAEFVNLNHQILTMSSEAAKLKVLGYIPFIPPVHLEMLLKVLEKIISCGKDILVLSDSEIEVDGSELNSQIERKVLTAANASLLSLHIMTSPNLSKTVYQEGVIDNILSFTKFQIQSSAYSPLDQANANGDGGKGCFSERKNSLGFSRKKDSVMLHSKLNEIMALLTNFLNIQVLTDVQVLCISSFCLPSLFMDSVEDLQLSSLKLISMVFSRYEKHRDIILDDIFVSISRFKSTSRFNCIYSHNSSLNISMFTALILHIVQSAVSFPDGISEDDRETSVDKLMCNKLGSARKVLTKFLPPFISVCGKKTDTVDLRPLLDSFVTDILITLNNPFWPVSEIIVINLATTLVLFFISKDAHMPLRVLSLEYFGRIVARLRRDGVSMQSKLITVSKLADRIREELQLKEFSEPKEKRMKEEKDDDDDDTRQIQLLQKTILCFLAENGPTDFSSDITRQFYIAQWYVDANDSFSKLDMKRKPNAKELPKPMKSSVREKNCTTKKRKSKDNKELESVKEEERNLEKLNLIEDGRRFLITEIKPFETTVTYGNRNRDSLLHVGHESAGLISCYFSSKRSFYSSFNVYLKQILRVLTEQNIAIRSRALKCLAMIVEVDPAVLGDPDMLLGVQYSFSDCAASVREAAIDLVGKYILQNIEFINKYFDMLTARIMDSSITVRKHTIRILSQICFLYPEFPKIPDIWFFMILKINDEEGVKKLIVSHFQNFWFSPMLEGKPSDFFVKKVYNMIDFVGKCKDPELEKFDHLLSSILNPKEDKHKSAEIPKSLLRVCHQIVDCLVENILQIEENCLVKDSEQAVQSKECDQLKNKSHSQRLSACFLTLYLFAKSRPQLLVGHALVLVPYLCQNPGGNQVISYVAKIFELVVPLLEHSSDLLLAQLEEFLMKAILTDKKCVVNDCLSCLNSVIKCRTHNYKLISDCLSKYYDHLRSCKLLHGKDSSDPWLTKSIPYSRRAMFTVGLMLKYFDFTLAEVRNDLPENIKDLVLETLMYFAKQPDQGLQSFAIQAVGYICIRHTETFFFMELKRLYMHLLLNGNASKCAKIQVLNILEMYLREEEKKNSKQIQEWSKISKKESLKEMNDVSSGMASAVVQLYLKGILESFMHSSETIRQAVLKVVKNVIQQGLVNPAQILPYLICMSTDVHLLISQLAEKLLQDLQRKYPGLLHMKSLEGINLSYKFQKLVQEKLVRGYRIQEDGSHKALIGYFYSILRSKKKERRAIIVSMLKKFGEHGKSSLSEMLYMADNLALLPYDTLDEPHFLIHHMDVILATSGLNVLQDFQEAFLPENELQFGRVVGEEGSSSKCNAVSRRNSSSGISDLQSAENESSLLGRIPEDTTVLLNCLLASHGYMLLLCLREHIKKVYSLKEKTILEYSPSKPNKQYEKTINRHCKTPFNPEVVLKAIKEEPLLDKTDVNGRKSMIKQYLKFKELILWFEKSDSDEEDAEKSGLSLQTSRTSTLSTESHSLSMDKESEASLDTTVNSSENCETPMEL